MTRRKMQLTHLLDGVHALDHLAEDDVLAVEPGGLGGAQEELAAVGVGAGVGHGQDARAGVLQLEVLVLELHAVDGLAARAVAGGEVAALQERQHDGQVVKLLKRWENFKNVTPFADFPTSRSRV